jgi:uncharacterized membrane protein
MLLRAASTGLFWFFCLGIALFSIAVAVLLTTTGAQQAAPHLAHYMLDHRIPLYMHIVFGPLALVLIPFQFWAGLRNRYRRLHRTLGYVYVVSVTLAALGALLLLPRFEGSAWATAGFGVLAILWLVSTARAVLHARAGRTDDHRAWMMRSASLTFAAVALRLMTLPLMATGMSLTQSYDITAWASWLLPLLVVEWRLRRSPASASAIV